LLIREIIAVCCIFALPVHSVILSPRDSLAILVSGGAAISFLHGAGQKASETGLCIASLDHSINNALHAVCAVRGGRNSLKSFIEEADIRWSFGSNEADAGFVSNRYGFALLYRQNSPYFFLFDKPVLWDASGFGFAYRRDMGRFFKLTAASSVNTRESGQAHALLSMGTTRFTSELFGGFQTYSSENQDNGISAGLEVRLRLDRIQMHGIAKSTDYLGYGHAANATMVPGESTIGFLECSWTPVPSINVSAVSYYLKAHKRYDHEFFFEGLEFKWIFFKQFGLGAGCEWQKDDDVASLMPRFFTMAVPSPDHACLEVSLQPTVVHGAIISYRLSGELWIRL
jgi:hypothetical protein